MAFRYSRCPVKYLLWLLIMLACNICTVLTSTVGNALVNYTFSPPYLDKLIENTNQTVYVHVVYQRHRFPSAFAPSISQHKNSSGFNNEIFNNSNNSKSSPPPALIFNFKSDDTTVARVARPGDGFTKMNFSRETMDDNDDPDEDGYESMNISFVVTGVFLGKTKIFLSAGLAEKDSGGKNIALWSNFERLATYDVWVVRVDTKLTHIFVGTLSILLIIANVILGAQLNLNVVWSVVKKPLAPAVGFVCQFAVMPLISYTLAHIFFVPYGLHNLGLGLFTTGCSPGGGASNAYTVLLDGNIDLSITMTFLSTLLALAMMPLWMFALGRTFLVGQADQHIRIPYRNICYSLLILVLPLCAGVILRRFSSKWADYAKRVLRPFLCVIILFICTFGVYANLYMFRLMNWRVLIGGLALPWLGFLFGLVIAAAIRQPRPNIVAISIETGIQNTGIAIMLLKLSFLQPDADLAAVMPVVVAMFTPAPMIVALIAHHVIKWRKEKKKRAEKTAASVVEEARMDVRAKNDVDRSTATADDATRAAAITCPRNVDEEARKFLDNARVA